MLGVITAVMTRHVITAAGVSSTEGVVEGVVLTAVLEAEGADANLAAYQMRTESCGGAVMAHAGRRRMRVCWACCVWLYGYTEGRAAEV